MKYRARPVVIEAFKWLHDEVPDWWKSAAGVQIDPPTACAIIPTLEGTFTVKPGDYIVQGIRGELYSCRADIFEEKYEPA